MLLLQFLNLAGLLDVLLGRLLILNLHGGPVTLVLLDHFLDHAGLLLEVVFAQGV